MTALFWLPAAFRALATALLVVSASALAEAVGPFWGALVASLPVSAGPTYVFLSMQHDAGFVSASALASLAANAAAGLFLIVYGLLAARMAGWKTLAVALASWFAACLAIRQVEWSPIGACAVNSVVYGAGFRLLSAARRAPMAVVVMKRHWLELPGRAIAVAGFVTLVVATSSLLGAAATGIAAVFPVSLISLIVILRRRMGAAAVAAFTANALRPMLGFGASLLALHLVSAVWGATPGLLSALSVSLAWSVLLLLLRPRTGRRAS